jgi:type VII secretion-associated serine protease mycosin
VVTRVAVARRAAVARHAAVVWRVAVVRRFAVARWVAVVRRVAVVTGVAALVCGAVPGVGKADQYRALEEPVLDQLSIQQAWNVSKGDGVTVAVVDSGVDPANQDLAGKVTTGPDYAAGANPPGVAPKRLHGTNMASIIAGHGHGPGGGDGVIGVAPDAKLLSIRVLLEKDEPGFATYSTKAKYDDTISKGIRYATDHGAQVINMSLGRRSPSAAERRAVAYATAKGVVVVASAGNDGDTESSGSSTYSYPASYPGVISVAAVDSDRKAATFSDRNGAVMVSAPGVNVIGAGPGNTYWHGDGTSPAAAFVSGIAALIRSKYPQMTPGLVAQAIARSTVARPSGGYDTSTGFGEVNASTALQAAHDLSVYKTSGMGLAGAQHFVLNPPGPVEIVHHDRSLLATASGVAVAAFFTLLGTVVALLARRRRTTWAAPGQDRGSFGTGSGRGL